MAQSIITEKPGAATKLLYQLYIALQKKKKSGLTGVELQTMQPQTSVRLQNMKSEAFREVGTPPCERGKEQCAVFSKNSHASMCVRNHAWSLI
jgi:hypothetical protein